MKWKPRGNISTDASNFRRIERNGIKVSQST